MARIDLRTAIATLDHLAALPPPKAAIRLATLHAALATWNDRESLDELAQSFPLRVAPLAPEVCLALHDLAVALAPYRPRIPVDALTLEPRLATAWARAWIASGDEACLDAMDETLLLRVVTGWSGSGPEARPSEGRFVESVPAPLPLLTRLSRANDVRLRAAALEGLRPAVQHLAITPQEAFACVEPLAEAPEISLRCASLRALAQVWLRGVSPAAMKRRERIVRAAIDDADPNVMRAAIETTAELGAREWLVEVIEGGAASDDARAAAITALGPLAAPDDVDAVLATLDDDLLRFAPGVRAFLLEAHRHGVFVRESHLAQVLRSFDAHANANANPTGVGWTGDELVRVTHIVRADLVHALAELPADDLRWRHRAAILSASVGTGAHLVLADLLERTTSADVAAALVDAAGRSSEYEGEDRLLRWLDAAPETVIPVLRVKGGANAVTRLRAIVDDRFTGHARRALAMDALWALHDDRAALLRDLSRSLGPHESGLLDSKYRSQRDDTAARILEGGGWDASPHNAVEPIRQLEVLCEAGEIRSLPEVTRLFRDVFRRYVRLALEGDFSIKRLQLPELEQMLFRYGRHLVKDGRSVRRWIEDGPETGRDLVLSTICDWLKEAPSNAVCVALLEVAARHAPAGPTLRTIESFWRRGDPNVKRAAIEAILGAGDGGRGLELSLCRLADAADPRILCQALAAARTLRASWAEPMVRAALGRPEMAVKKEAAEALAEVGNGHSVPALVRWIASHDNDSFRASLLKALQYVAGPSLVAVLVDALDAEAEGEDDARRRELLTNALSGHLTLSAALRLARSPRRAHRELVDACLDGRVRVVGATSDELAAHLHRARLRSTEPAIDPARRLRVDGFSVAAAKAVVAARESREASPAVLDAQILPVVRAGLADWVSWIASSPDAGAAAVALVLDAADRSHAEQMDRLLDVLERRDGSVDPGTITQFFDRVLGAIANDPEKRLRALAVLRALPAAPRTGWRCRYLLLARLGAVRAGADLERCLAECRVGPNVAGDSFALLCEAFAIPPKRDDDPDELVALREAAREWYRTDEKTRDAWLAATLRARPLDLPVPPPPAKAQGKPVFAPSSRDDLDALLRTLREGDAQERRRAASRILAWGDAHDARRDVLDAYLDGRVDLDREGLRLVANALTSWPAAASDRAGGASRAILDAQTRAAALIPFFSARRTRAFVVEWLRAWDDGEARAAEWLGAVDPENLFGHVRARAERGNYTLVRLLRPGSSLALRAIIDLVAAKAPEEVEHLLAKALPAEPDAAAAGDDPVDPIAGKDVEHLARLIDEKGVDKGLAVRAVHALTAHRDRAAPVLERLAVDRRPEVRSAALRALRAVTSREETLRVVALVLAMETRRDIVLQLMSSLGHGRYEPALPVLIERLVDGDPRVSKGAHAALRAWGRDAIPALRHAARRARPDRRPRYAALLAELE